MGDLAGDVEAGRAPVPRCTGERHALELMIDCAPQLLACSEDQLRQLGITVPHAVDEYDYRAPLWDSAGQRRVGRSDATFAGKRAAGQADKPAREGVNLIVDAVLVHAERD
ncbi:hypothetical protein GCM10012275_61960 [Longimycelium tulufanense]|uniref:Uncharacterized protein n=1 Tax=Longimycelium tulufanense TaxID=907463 RepID=A0A8J3CIW2_9PSEU|nr:hypothetical protein GCM10012275_61960 [Longimycelium tulufanense]